MSKNAIFLCNRLQARSCGKRKKEKRKQDSRLIPFSTAKHSIIVATHHVMTAIVGNRLFMIVKTALNFDWDTAMARLATLPRQAEWEDYVAAFQQCASGSTSDEKWQMMERMFFLY